MDRLNLRLAPALRDGRAAPSRGARWTAVYLLAAVGLTIWMGSGRARRDVNAQSMAVAGLAVALERGNDAPEVRATLVDLRRILVRRPLDGRTRVSYAGLTASLSRSTDELQVAAFHARLAARLAPVTVPVVRGATLILARAGEAEEGTALIRQMFHYDPAAAARLLVRTEPLLYDRQIRDAVADTPAAWLAWSLQLRKLERDDQADEWLDRGVLRWPDHLPLLVQASAKALGRENWTALNRLLPPRGGLPGDPAAAILFTYRARLRLQQQDRQGASSDLAEALKLNGRSPTIQILAGDAYELMGETDQARNLWNRALFSPSLDATAHRRSLLRRLARLEEKQANAGSALRLWRSIIELDPEDPEARRRIAVLTGVSPQK